MSEGEQALDLRSSFSKAWQSVKQPDLDGENPHFHSRYATLANMQSRIREACAANGIAYTQSLIVKDGGQSEIASAVVGGAERMELSRYPISLAQNPQSNGSLMTYIKRQLCGIDWGICGDEDDDANAASGNGVTTFDLYRDALTRAKARGVPIKDAMAYVESVVPKPRDEYGDFEIRCAVLLVDSMRAPGKPPEEDGEEVSF